MNAATPHSVSLLWRSGITGAVLSGVLNLGLPGFLTIYGSGPWTFLLLYVWLGVLSPAGALGWLLGRPWHLELHGSLFNFWPQILASWLVDGVLLGAVVAALLVINQKCFARAAR